jgi:hypothetical protein
MKLKKNSYFRWKHIFCFRRALHRLRCQFSQQVQVWHFVLVFKNLHPGINFHIKLIKSKQISFIPRHKIIIIMLDNLPGCKIFRPLYMLAKLNMHCHCVHMRKINASKKFVGWRSTPAVNLPAQICELIWFELPQRSFGQTKQFSWKWKTFWT